MLLGSQHVTSGADPKEDLATFHRAFVLRSSHPSERGRIGGFVLVVIQPAFDSSYRGFAIEHYERVR